MSSAENLSFNELDKNFSNAVITWDIERFSLITPDENLICSPPITLVGPIETVWQIHLLIQKAKNTLLLKVEMLSESQLNKKCNSEVSKVNLHWAFCLVDETETSSFSTERIYSYEPKTVLTLEYISLESALEIANKKKRYDLTLKCHMLVDFSEEIAFPKTPGTGVQQLSNALCNLPTSFLYHDTTVAVNNVEFSLHKAMLFLRGKNLVRFMKQSTSNANNFSLSKTKAATAVLQYLYTGNLKYILDDPCLAISDYTKHLEIPEMENVYAPQRITLSSILPFREHSIIWNVPDLKNITKTVFGPEFKIEGLDSCFQLSLKVEASKDDPPRNSLFVEVTLIKSKLLLDLCLEFAFGKDESQMLCTRRLYDKIGPKEGLGITFLENDCPEMKECFLTDTLSIKVSVYVTTGKALSYIVKNVNTISRKISNEKSLMSLSKTLEEMKKTGYYSDFYFEVCDQKIKAHKFLVATRSPLMKELFRRHEGLESVEIHGCSKEVFEKFLYYMYVGILTENDCEKLIELYNFGEPYHVDGFVEIVLIALLKCINKTNMLKILMFADEIKDDRLQKCAFDYVVSKGNETLEKHDDRDIFRCKKPHIYTQIQNKLLLM